MRPDDTGLEKLLRRRAAEETGALHPGPGCGDPETLAAYAECRLLAGARQRFEGHLAGCPACQTAVARLVRLAPEEAARLAAPVPRRWFGFPAFRWNWALPALASAVLVGSLAYYERGRITAPPETPATSPITQNAPLPTQKQATPPPETPLASVAVQHEARPRPAPPELARETAPTPAPARKEAVEKGRAEVAAAAPLLVPPPPVAQTAAAEGAAPENKAKPALTAAAPAAAGQVGGVVGGVATDRAAPPLPVQAAPQAVLAVGQAKSETKAGIEQRAATPQVSAEQRPRPGEQAQPVPLSQQEEIRARTDAAQQAAQAGAILRLVPEAAAGAGAEEKAAKRQAAPEAFARGAVSLMPSGRGVNTRAASRSANAVAKLLEADSRGLALISAGRLLAGRPSDQLSSWKAVVLPLGARVLDFAVVHDDVWVLFQGGRVAHSTDAGSTWKPAVDSGARDAASIAFADARSGTIVTRTGSRFRSTDGGLTWRKDTDSGRRR